MADLHNGIWHVQINILTFEIYTKTLDGAEHWISNIDIFHLYMLN